MFNTCLRAMHVMLSLALFTSIAVHADAPKPPPAPPVPVDPIPVDPIRLDPSEIFGDISLVVRLDPANPHNEQFLGDWVLDAHAIDDDGFTASPSFYGHTDFEGSALVSVPLVWLSKPIVVGAHSSVLPEVGAMHRDEFDDNRYLEILIPPYCYDKAVWMVGPFEHAVWNYYKNATLRRGDAWNPSQLDCATWLANLQLMILTEEVTEELEEKAPLAPFDQAVLDKVLQRNQQFLVPTRPPICVAERRHQGGSLERGEEIAHSLTETINLDRGDEGLSRDVDPILVNGHSGVITDICNVIVATSGTLTLNGSNVSPTRNYWLDEQDFVGVAQSTSASGPATLDIFHTRLGNGLSRENELYDDACAVTSVLDFGNTTDDEFDIRNGDVVTFNNLFGEGARAVVYATSDGDAFVDNDDTWAIFTREGDVRGEEQVVVVELLGHRKGDFRDVLYLNYDNNSDNLAIAFRADYSLNEQDVDGEHAYLKYTVHTWDGSTKEGRSAVRKNLVNCFKASDPWAQQFFATSNFNVTSTEAAEIAARSQCFSNSLSNQRWNSESQGFWSINTDHGVHGNVIINPGWLAPNLAFNVYIQKFDEEVFKGPRTLVQTDSVGQAMIALPTLVEGDRVLLKAKNKCCDDYDLVLPCVPEFTGFHGYPGIPYAPVTVAPPRG